MHNISLNGYTPRTKRVGSMRAAGNLHNQSGPDVETPRPEAPL